MVQNEFHIVVAGSKLRVLCSSGAFILFTVFHSAKPRFIMVKRQDDSLATFP